MTEMASGDPAAGAAPPPGVSALADANAPVDAGVLASRLLLAFQKELFRRLAEQGHAAIRPRHGAVLAFIDPGGTRAIDLSQRSGQHKQVIGTLVDELESLGYVTREPDPTDRRAKLIVPTSLGLDQMARARRIHEAMEARYAARVGPVRYRLFKEVFAEVASLADAGSAS